MHKIWFRRGGLLAALALIPAVANATSITLTPPSQNADVGDSFDLALHISGLGGVGGSYLGAFDMDLNFNPTLTQLNSFTFGDPALGDLLGPVVGSVSGDGPSSAGTFNVFSFSLDDPADLVSTQPGDFTLGTFHFTALSPGLADFDLANIILGDENGDPLTFDATGANARINSTSVPEGNLGWLPAIAFGVVILSHRRLRDQPATS